MFDWFRRLRGNPSPRVTLDQLVARGRALNADYARRRHAARSSNRREHIRRLIEDGFVRPRQGESDVK